MCEQTVSLVLSSGGARGLAHIGAIQSLEQSGYRIRYISGSSIGALIGGIYAAGELDDYETWVKALRRKDIVQLLDFGWGRGGGLFRGERIIDALRDLIGEHQIEDLAIGFTAVATDLRRKREVWLDKGPLFAAIRASIAVPLLFSPVIAGNQVLIDGGVLNPLPIAPTLNDDSDLIIAMDVNGIETGNAPWRAIVHKQREKEQTEKDDRISRAISSFIDGLWPTDDDEPQEHGMLDIALEAMDAMQASIARHNLSVFSPDVIVQVPRSAAQFFEFERADELIRIGFERMRSSLEALEPRDELDDGLT